MVTTLIDQISEDIVETIREPLLVLDSDLKVILANQSFYDSFKVKPEETVGQLIYDIGNRQWDIPKLRELLENILPEKTSFDNYEVEHDFATIGKRVMLLNARQIEQAMGKERIILLAIEDITARKEIEAGLEKTRKELVIIKKSADEAHEFADSVINTVREPLISLDQDLRVVTVSRSFYDFFKVKPEETVGQLIYDLGNKQWDIPRLRELLETILPEKTSFDNYEVEHDFATIGRRTMLLNARQIQRGMGKERIILLAIEDITERKKIEDGLEKSSEKLKFFAYSISHDLKSPAIGLYGLTKRLYKDYADILDEKGQRYCEHILKAAEQIAELVEQINVFITTKETPLTIERLALKEVLQVIREEFSSQLSIQEIRWSEPDYIPEIEADRLCIIRALSNLVDNALKYGGEALSEIDIVYKESLESHILSITDNGIGLKQEDYHEDIFTPFIRRKTSKGIQGSGMGLAIVREIAEKHGGDVWLEPGQERGITFYISISNHLQLSR